MNYFFICGIILIIISIFETILKGTWNKKYFLYGIPFFSKEIEFTNTNKTSEEITYFINHMNTVKDFSTYTGRIFEENTFAFRRKIFSNKSDDIHGTIIIDPENRILKIKCYPDYTFILFLIYIYLFFIDNSESILISSFKYLIFISILSLIFYAFSRSKSNKLFTEISKLIL